MVETLIIENPDRQRIPGCLDLRKYGSLEIKVELNVTPTTINYKP